MWRRCHRARQQGNHPGMELVSRLRPHGLVLWHAVKKYLAIAEMDLVTTHGDDALYQEESRFGWRDENSRVTTVKVAIRRSGHFLLAGGRHAIPKTWSPIRSVRSMELEGISKCCRTKVMMKSPETNTLAKPASASERSPFQELLFSGGPF